MNARPDRSSTTAKHLRTRAERLHRKTGREVAPMPADEVQRLVHELQLHQIELEMKNDELRRTQQALEQARDRYANLYDFAPSAHLTLSANGEILEANLSAGQLLGLERHRLIRQKFTRFIPTAAQNTFCLLCRQVFGSDARQSVELDLVSARAKRLVVQLETVRDPVSPRKHLRVTLTDITERKKMEQASRESEERFRQVTETIDQVFWMTTADKKQMLYVSPGYERIWGRTCQSLYDSPRTWLDAVHPDDRVQVAAVASTTKQASGEYDVEYRILRPDGSERWIHDRAFPVRDASGNVRRIAGVADDITGRKQAEKDLGRLNQKNELILRSAAEGILGLDMQGNHTFVNPAAAMMLGYEAEELLGRHSHSTWHHTKPDGSAYPEEECGIYAAYRDGIVHRASTEVFWRKNGTSFPVEYASTPIREQGLLVGAVVTFTDITERKRAEERIAQLSRVRAILADISRAIVHLPDRQKLLDTICRVAVDTGGFKLAWIGMVEPDGSVQPVAQAGATGYLKGIRVVTHDVPEGLGPVGTAIRENRPVVIEDVDRDGRMVPWHDRALKFGLYYVAAFPIRIAGKVAGAFQVYAPRADFFDENELGLLTQVSDEISFALAALADLTARKQVEEALLDSNRFNQQIIASAKDGIIVYDRDLKYRVWNPRMEEMSGVPAAEVIGKYPTEVFPFLREAGLIQRLKRARAGATGTPLDFQYHVVQTGRSGWVSDIYAPLRNAKGEIIGVIGIAHDITERKLKEEALRASENELAAIYEHTPLIMLLVDADRRVCKMNRFAKRFAKYRSTRRHGLTHGEALRCLYALEDPKGCGFGAHCEDCTIRRTILDTLETGRRHYQVAASLLFSHQGQVQTLTLLVSSTRLKVPEQPHVLVTLENITEREQAEQLLRRSEQNLTDSFNQAPIGLEWLSPSGSILRANQAQLDLLGYSAGEYLGHFFGEFCADPAGAHHLMERLAANETVRNLRMLRRRKDGALRLVLVDAQPLWNEGQFHYSSIFSRDITERTNLEREILEISEREHRRIAQDLHDGLGQLLVGTAYLGDTLRQELAAKSLPEVQQLDRLLRVLEEAIRQTRSLARGLHPVKPEPNGLMVALKELASQTESLFKVRCRFTCRQPVLVEDGNTATHLYRIAQEAVTNAIKHGKSGLIQISLTQTPGWINLAVRDDGVGLPTRPRKHKGMGLRIMRYRAGTFGGSLAIQKEPGRGTTIVCSVPLSAEGLPNHPERAIENNH